MTAETADQAPGEASFQRLAEHLTALAGERRQLDMDGYDPPDRLWSLHFAPLGGGDRGGMLLCRDVTEQRRAEELLRASQRQLAEAQRIAQVGSWEWDLETDALTVSDEALGGRFRVTTAPGQGTVVEARLPLTVAAEEPGT